MRVVLKAGPGTDFPPCSLEVQPDNTVSEMLSLMTMRHSNLDANYLRAEFQGRTLSDEETIIQVGIREDDVVQVTYHARSRFCSLQ